MAIHLLIQEKLDLVFYVYGSNMPDEIYELGSKNVVIKGYAEQLAEVYNSHKVFICPLTFGAGIKGKLIDALAYGMPTVASEIAAEGTGLKHGINAYIPKNNEDWVECIRECYFNEDKWLAIRQNGIALVKNKYNQSNAVRQFRTIFSRLGL